MCVFVCMYMLECMHGSMYACVCMYSSCQTMGEWHEVHGRMPLSYGQTTSL